MLSELAKIRESGLGGSGRRGALGAEFVESREPCAVTVEHVRFGGRFPSQPTSVSISAHDTAGGFRPASGVGALTGQLSCLTQRGAAGLIIGRLDGASDR